jgi:GNAT superfamily N-acetyltransferase
MPAVREETVSRLAGIALIFGLTRRRWLAILIPGALWAGAHISYVRDPIYLRGIELLPVAILYALFFLRFGLVTTIAAHMTYNASLGMLPMLRSGEPYFIFSGLVVALALLAPMLPGLYRLAQRRWRGQPMAEAQPAIGSAASSDLSGLAALPIQGVDWDELLNDPDRAVYCLRVDEKVIGAAVGRLEGETGKLEAVYVAREWRGRYWGSALSEAVCATLQEKGAQAIQADLQARDRLALAFISGQGWRAQRQVFGRGPLPSFPDWRSWLRKRIKKS